MYEKEEFGRLLNLLDEVIEAGINVVLTAHAQLRKFEQPDEMGAYDRWELKLGKKTASQISPLIKEWADMVLFANYQTFAVATDDKGKKFKAQGGQRVMYTSHHPCWDAKNRDGLAEMLPFDYTKIMHCIPKSRVIKGVYNPEPKDWPKGRPGNPEQVSDPVQANNKTAEINKADTQKANAQSGFVDIDVDDTDNPFADINGEPEHSVLPKALTDLMSENGVTEKEIQHVVAIKGYYPEETPIQNYDAGFINGVIIGAWKQVKAMIMEQRDTLTF